MKNKIWNILKYIIFLFLSIQYFSSLNIPIIIRSVLAILFVFIYIFIDKKFS